MLRRVASRPSDRWRMPPRVNKAVVGEIQLNKHVAREHAGVPCRRAVGRGKSTSPRGEVPLVASYRLRRQGAAPRITPSLDPGMQSPNHEALYRFHR
jgi:hypothetical protein